MRIGTGRLAAFSLTALLCTPGTAAAGGPIPPHGDAGARSPFVRLGHDPTVLPAFKRFVGMVTALGPADGQGRIYSFRIAQIGPDGLKQVAEDQLRGWRLTILAGKRFSSHFVVRSNTASEIVVTPMNGPLNGLAERDVLIVEDVPPAAAPPERS